MKSRIFTCLWSAGIMLASLAFTIFIASRQKIFVEEQGIASPDVQAAPVTLYFFAVVAVMAVILFFIPLNKLKYVFRILFTIMYGWGAFVITALLVPDEIWWLAWLTAAVFGLGWLFYPRIWVQNVALLLALCAAGSVFGFLFSPWTFMIFMLIVALYDFLAVRFGFMVWMADRLSDTVSLPAFVFPRHTADLSSPLSFASVGEIKEQQPGTREFAILGGGDIGFPLMLVVSVYFAYDAAAAWLVGLFATAGLILAFVIQAVWLKGKPMPALPPIAALSLIGWLITLAWL